MGLEIKTTARRGKLSAVGRLHLDSKQLSFSSQQLKWSADLTPELKAATQGSLLIVSQGRDKVSFEVGEQGDRWVQKILNPPSRIDKLGVKPAMACWLSKGFDKGLKDELRSAGARLVTQLDRCQLAFLHLNSRDALGALVELAQTLPAGVNVWVVWPKGSSAIAQADVMEQAKKLGLGPSKTAAFDASHSSLRFAKKRAVRS